MRFSSLSLVTASLYALGHVIFLRQVSPDGETGVAGVVEASTGLLYGIVTLATFAYVDNIIVFVPYVRLVATGTSRLLFYGVVSRSFIVTWIFLFLLYSLPCVYLG